MKLGEFFPSHRKELTQFFKTILSIRSLSGREKEVQEFLKEEFSRLGLRPELQPFPPSIESHPEYIHFPEAPPSEERRNLLLFWEGGEGREIILNTHCDVVGEGDWKEAFSPREKNGLVYGRGAVDCKGQITALYLTFLAIKEMGLRIKRRGHLQIVVEEEVGGNGTLATILNRTPGEAVIVMEPTSLDIHPANRGALWFRIKVKGKPVHMGRKHEGVNAIEKMMEVITSLGDYERKLLEESKGYPLFEEYPYPVQVNVGMIRGGSWPSMVAEEAVIEGGVGFLPNKNIPLIKKELKHLLDNHPDPWIRNNYTLEFTRLHNEAYEISPQHWLVRELVKSSERCGHSPRVRGFIVSCDARLFYHVGKLPVVVFGAGDIRLAHSREERVNWEEIIRVAEILVDFLTHD